MLLCNACHAELATMILACCRFLRPGGAVLPDIASMYVAGAGPGALDLDFWNDVYGFSYRYSRPVLSATSPSALLPLP